MKPAAQQAWTWFKRIAPWALAALVLTLVARQARTVEWPAVWQALQALSLAQLFTAAGLALLSYGLYASFDLVGRRLTGHALSVPRTLRVAATSYAFNLNFGALVGGFGLRLRLYLRGGLSAPTVAQVIAHSMVTNWLGYLWVGGAVLLAAPPRLTGAWAQSDLALRAIGVAMIALALAYLALCGWSRRRELNWRGHTLALPGGRLAALQALLGGASWLLIGAIVWSLFGGRIDYPTVLGALLLAAVAGVLTHVPAGLGVLEAVNGPLFYELRAELNQGKAAGADILGADRGIGVEGGAPPAAIVSIAPNQIYRPGTPEEARVAIREMKGRGTDLVKVWLDDFGKSLPAKVAPSIYAALVDESHKNNLRVAAHIHDMDDAKAILSVGGDIIAHGVRDKPVDAELIALMKKRNAWYIATLALDDSNFVFADKPEVALDPLVAPWIHPQMKTVISDRAWQERVRATPGAANARRALAMNKTNLLAMYKAGVQIGFGSDSGVGLRIPGIAEHRELVLMVEAGLTPLQSLTIATSNAAKLLKLEDRGSIQAGKRADLVVLDADPLQNIANTLRINSVWHRGVQIQR